MPPISPPSLPSADPDPRERALGLHDARVAWRRGNWNGLNAFAAATPFREMPRPSWVLRIVPALFWSTLNDLAYNLSALWRRHHVALPAGTATRTLQGVPDAARSASKGNVVRQARRGAGLRAYRGLDWWMARTLGVSARSETPAPPTPTRLSDYKRVYAAVSAPSLTGAWKGEEDGLTDVLFASLRLVGSNPEMLVRLNQLPAGFGSECRTPGGRTLAAALDAHELFVCDYSLLAVLKDSVWRGRTRYVTTPIAVFEWVEERGLVPVGIQCAPGAHVILPTDDGWQAAKRIVQVADGNYHELVAHLSRTHLLSELALIATRQNLSDRHPIARLLLPHFEGTVFINDHARASLIAPGGPIDQIFAGTLDSSVALAVQGLAGLDFSTYDLPTRSAARGTGAITNYPYRDDATLIWDAIATYTSGVVQAVYPNSAALLADPEMKEWSDALTQPVEQGGVPGFVPATTPDQLATQLATIIFTASAQHAAVNFTQFPCMSFAPLLSGAGWALAPTPGTTPALLDLLPPLPLAHQQADVLYLLSSVHHTSLGSTSRFDEPKLDALANAFRAALVGVQRTIETRNEKRAPELRYAILLPSAIPTSINI